MTTLKLPKPELLSPDSVPVLRWGVIGPGSIADVFVGATLTHTRQLITAVASRTPGRANSFAAKHGISTVHESYQDLVADPDIDAIYIASHQGDHFEHGMLALEGGKHILVEKPITYLPEQAEALLATARSKGLLAMEAMWTRYLPQSSIVRQLLATGNLGAPELFVASFCTDNRAVERLWKPGGGGIVFDMGIYPIAMAQQFMGNPTSIQAFGRVRRDGMDEESYAMLGYEHGGRAVLTMSGIATIPARASVSFVNAVVELHPQFLAPSGVSLLTKDFNATGETWIDDLPAQQHNGLSYQANYFAQYVGEGRVESPLHTHADVVANIRTAAEITRQIGARPF
jgi:predicted dehydrogenase